MPMADVIFLTGASPSAVRHAFIRARTLLSRDTVPEATAKVREQERRIELLEHRLSGVPADSPEARRLMAAFLAGECAGPAPAIIAGTNFAKSPRLWRELALAADRKPALFSVLTPIKITVSELCYDGVLDPAGAQIAWLSTYLPCVSDTGAYEAVLSSEMLTSPPSGLGAALEKLGFPIDRAAADAPPAPPSDGLPHFHLRTLLDGFEAWEPAPLLRQVQARLKGRAGARDAEEVTRLGEHQLTLWRSLGDGDRARPRGLSGNARKTSPFFILGAPRSGTTMLRNLLRQHPDLLAPEETFFFRSGVAFGSTDYRNFYERNPVVRKHRSMDGIAEEEFQKIFGSAATRRELSDGYMRRYAELQNRSQGRWFDKTPQNVYGLPLIAALYPEATIIHIHRHPIEVAASAMAGRGVGQHTLTGALNVWLEPMLIFDQCRPILGDRLIEFSIDEIKRSPRGTIDWLSGMLDLEPFSYNLEHLDRSLGSSVAEDNVSASDISFIEKRCEPYMLRYGYRPYATRRRSVTKAA